MLMQGLTHILSLYPEAEPKSMPLRSHIHAFVVCSNLIVSLYPKIVQRACPHGLIAKLKQCNNFCFIPSFFFGPTSQLIQSTFHLNGNKLSL